jgi:hypothetical protein
MTDGTAGWFRDPNDPALARWHDGERWTEHTLVIADQSPGVEPPPPVAVDPAPTSWDTAPAFSDPGMEPAATPAPAGGRGPLPTWAKVVAPLAVIAIAGIAFLLTQGGDSNDDKTETNGTELASLDAAVTAARRAGLTEEVSDARAAALIERICDVAETPSLSDELGQQLGNLPAATVTDLRAEVSALGAGAEKRCPDAMEKNSDLIDELSDDAAVAFSTTTTAVTVLPDGTASTVAGADGGTDGGTGTGTGGKTSTTKKGATATTAPRPTTTTTIRAGSLGSSCSSEGAVGVTADGRTRRCVRVNCATNPKLQWQNEGSRSCTVNTTTTVSGSIPPTPTTLPPTTTTTI